MLCCIFKHLDAKNLEWIHYSFYLITPLSTEKQKKCSMQLNGAGQVFYCWSEGIPFFKTLHRHAQHGARRLHLLRHNSGSVRVSPQFLGQLNGHSAQKLVGERLLGIPSCLNLLDEILPLRFKLSIEGNHLLYLRDRFLPLP